MPFLYSPDGSILDVATNVMPFLNSIVNKSPKIIASDTLETKNSSKQITIASL